MLDAIAGDDRVRTDLRDAGGDDVDVLAGERREVLIGEDRALAADHVVRRQCLAQFGGVADLATQLVAAHQLVGGEAELVADEADQPEPFDHTVEERAHRLADERNAANQLALEPGGDPIHPGGDDPWRGPLEDQQPPRRLLQFGGDELDGRGPRSR